MTVNFFCLEWLTNVTQVFFVAFSVDNRNKERGREAMARIRAAR